MSADLQRNLIIGVVLLALWVFTLSLAMRHPLPVWQRAGRSKKTWTAAHLVALVLGLAPVISLVFLLAVYPRLRRAAAVGASHGHQALGDHADPTGGLSVRRGQQPAGDAGQSGGGLRSEEAEPGTGVLAVYRSAGLLGAAGRMSVDLDGKRRWRLRQGRAEEARLLAGEHVVQAHMDWLSSKALQVTVTAGETVRIVVGAEDRASTAEGMALSPKNALDIAVVERFPCW